MNGAACTPQTTREPSVTVTMKNLRVNIEQLESEVNLVMERLDTILSGQDQPQPVKLDQAHPLGNLAHSEKSTDPRPEPITCKLALELAEFNGNISRMNRLLNDIRNRVEL